MALTGMQIYKNLPKTNCKDCGLPTCMAFAMQVAAKQRSLSDCPHISDDATSALSEASAPPIKLVKVGAEGKQREFGQETVMFRHEEKFHRPCGIAIAVPGGSSDDDASALVEKANNSTFTRVGDELSVGFIAVEIDEASDAAGRAKLVADKSKLPLILVGKDEGKMKAAVDAIASERPLIYSADASNIDTFAGIAAEKKLPLAVHGKDLEELSELTAKAKGKGVEELVLAFINTEENTGEVVRSLTVTRRAALKQRYKEFGYPSMVEIREDTSEAETIRGAIFAAKYASIVLIKGSEPWELLPIMVTVQDVYTDPQVPNTVEAKLYEIGNVNENSPVLFTTNFSLTYFSVAGEVERSKVPTYISVVDTEGLGVLNAYAGDKISAEKVVKTLEAQKVKEKVKHDKLIIPGLLPIFRAEIEDTSDWNEVIIGPENAREIPAFLQQNWK